MCKFLCTNLLTVLCGDLVKNFMFIEAWFDSKCGWYSPEKWFYKPWIECSRLNNPFGITTPPTVSALVNMTAIRLISALRVLYLLSSFPKPPTCCVLLYFANTSFSFSLRYDEFNKKATWHPIRLSITTGRLARRLAGWHPIRLAYTTGRLAGRLFRWREVRSIRWRGRLLHKVGAPRS